MSRVDPRATCATCLWFDRETEVRGDGTQTEGTCMAALPMVDDHGTAFWPAIRAASDTWCREHEYVQQAAA